MNATTRVPVMMSFPINLDTVPQDNLMPLYDRLSKLSFANIAYEDANDIDTLARYARAKFMSRTTEDIAQCVAFENRCRELYKQLSKKYRW